MFYKENYRRLKNENITIKDILGKEKIRLIKKGIEEFKNNNISYEVRPLEDNDIQEFLKIYKPFIENKENPKNINIQKNIEKWKSAWKGYFICCIKQNNINIWMSIFALQKKLWLFILWYRAYKEEKINKISIGYYLEYFFLNEWIQQNIQEFSRWMDRNGYGFLWSKIGLALHKLELKFKPHAKKEEILNIRDKDIDKESLFFSEPDAYNKYTKAILYTNKTEEDISKYFWIIKKRWLILEVRKIDIQQEQTIIN